MKILCIGRNYAAHAQELNNEIPEKPLWFMKPESALLLRNRPLFYPDFTRELHYETELVYRICKVGKHIDTKFAHNYYDALALGFDFTARDLQARAKQKGHPWEEAKAFDGSAALSSFIPKEEFADLGNIHFSMTKNGKLMQQGNSANMLFSIDRLIAHLSRFVTLKMGDLIFTGTPKGVGPVSIGDELEGFIEGRSMLKTRIK